MKKISFSRFSGLDRIRIAPTWAIASVRIVGWQDRPLGSAVPEVPLIKGNVLDADNPLIGLARRHAVHQEERVAMRQNTFDRGVVERQLHGHRCRTII